jgi:hypothetical protein
VEEAVDSISEVASTEERDEHRYECERPMWRVAREREPEEECKEDEEDDAATIVPEDNDLFEEKITKDAEVKVMGFKRERPVAPGRDNWKLRESGNADLLEGVKYGKEERAVDVPGGESIDFPATTYTPTSKYSNKAKAAAGKRGINAGMPPRPYYFHRPSNVYPPLRPSAILRLLAPILPSMENSKSFARSRLRISICPL